GDVVDAGNPRRGMRAGRPEADDAGLARRALVANVNVIATHCEAVASQRANGDVTVSGGISLKGIGPEGGITIASGVVLQRTHAKGGAVVAARIKIERLIPHGCVVARRVFVERTPAG